MSARTCEFLGCSQITREGKPFCFDHCYMNPHAAQVLASIAAMRGDPGQGDGAALLGEEIVSILRQHGGAASLDRLVQLARVKKHVFMRAMRPLLKDKRVKLRRGLRGQQIALLKETT